MLHLTMKMKRPFFHSIYLFGLTGSFYEIFIAMFFKENSDQQLFDQIQLSAMYSSLPYSSHVNWSRSGMKGW